MTNDNNTSASHIDEAAIGVEVSWSFGYGDALAVTLPRNEVRAALHRNGFDPLRLVDLSEDEALRKAQYIVKGRSKSIVIQQLRRPNKDTPRAFGVYKVVGKQGEAGDDVRMGARVRCGAGQVVCLPPEGDTCFIDTECERIGNNIAAIANSLLNDVVNREISDLLCSIGWDLLGWISRRRNSGGVYFASRCDVTERFVALLQDLEKLSHEYATERVSTKVVHNRAALERAHHFVPQVMEVYPKPLTMSMWKGSAQDQYASQTEALIKDLQKMQGEDGDKMRDSTVAARAAECDRLITQAESHRLFLEGAADVISDELKRIRDAFTKRLADNNAEANAAFDAIDDATPKKKRRKKAAKKADPAPTPAPTPAPERGIDDMTADELFNVG